MPVPTMRTLAAGLGEVLEVCQPASLLPSAVRVSSVPFLTGFSLQQRASSRLGEELHPLAPPAWWAEPGCSILRQYPASLRFTLLEAANDSAAPGVAAGPAESSSSVEAEAAPVAVPTKVEEEAPEEPEEVQRPARKGVSRSMTTQTMPIATEPAASPKAPLAAAALMVRDYEMRLRHLERQCRELGVENLHLRSDLEVSQKQTQKNRELNLRLGQEVLDARRLRSEANKEVHKLSEELLLRGAAEPVDEKAEDLLEAEQPSASLAEVMPPPGLEGGWPLLEPVEAGPPLSLGFGLQLCSTCDVPGWGCEEHQVYSDRLLLAHRDMSLELALGAPGLERPPHSGAVESFAGALRCAPRPEQVAVLRNKKLVVKQRSAEATLKPKVSGLARALRRRRAPRAEKKCVA